MIEVQQTEAFASWFAGLRDTAGRRVLGRRLARIAVGLFGDTKSVGHGVSELRIDYGPGYRIYFTRRGNTVVLLLCGGDKDSQARDIAAAKQMVRALED